MNRMPPLNPADADFVETLSGVLPRACLRPGGPAYLEEPRGIYRGTPGPVVAPGSVEEVAAVVKACARARVGIVPYGGGTGLVGGQLLPEGTGPAPVILSLERMTRIRAVHAEENVLVAEAGAILADMQAAAAAADRLFPLSLASEGSCRIGGNLSTNAGGVGVLRYGNARALCLGLEAVLPDGSVWHGLKRLRKDNTGYDLRDLLIGAEGTLGVITAASLRLFPRPASLSAAFLAVRDPQAALELLALAGDRLGESISSFELISGQGMHFLRETGLDCPDILSDVPDWSVLIELGLPQGRDGLSELEELFEAALTRGLVSDGALALNEAQRLAMWKMREEIPEANRRIGSISSHDIALPLGAIPEFIVQAGAAIAAEGPFRINCFGHLGDGNLHFNVFPPAGARRGDFPGATDAVRAIVYGMVQDLGGSFSAEHGIGRLKIEELERFGDPAGLAAMRAIKAAMDPAGIMNPGAVFR